jgi:uncharacterized protein YjiS (DUF1127 family)
MEQTMSTLSEIVQSSTPIRARLPLARWARLVKAWRRRSRERAQLGQMTSRELRDAGISLADAWLETSKWFWRE